MLAVPSKKPLRVFRLGRAGAPSLDIVILFSYGSLLFLSWFFTPSLHAGVYPLRPSSCSKFIVLASFLCVTVGAPLDPFLTMKPCSDEVHPQILLLACIRAKPWATGCCIPCQRNSGEEVAAKTVFVLCLCTFKQRQVQWLIPPWAIVSRPLQVQDLTLLACG